MKLSFLKAGLFAALAFSAVSALGQNVLILAADAPAWAGDVKNTLINGAQITGSIDIMDVRVATPTLGQLNAYDTVLCYSDYSFANNVLLGDVLADYADEGHGVVLAALGNYDFQGIKISGRLASGGYLPFTLADLSASSRRVLGTVALPNNPIMNGVSTFDGGSSSYHALCTVTAGSTLVASWDNGSPLVAYRSAPSGAKVVGLNFFPPSSNVLNDCWDAATDGGKLLANALRYSTLGAAPVFSGLGTKTGYAHTVNSTIVNYTLPTATDFHGNPVTVFVDMAPGVGFPAGNTTVHAIATDSDGQSTYANFTVSVTYRWSELLAGLAPGPMKIVHSGQTLNAVFNLIGSSNGIRNVPWAALYYENTQDGIKYFVGWFKFTKPAKDYELNWDTTGMKNGIYRLTVDLGDGAPHLQTKIKIVK